MSRTSVITSNKKANKTAHQSRAQGSKKPSVSRSMAKPRKATVALRSHKSSAIGKHALKPAVKAKPSSKRPITNGKPASLPNPGDRAKRHLSLVGARTPAKSVTKSVRSARKIEETPITVLDLVGSRQPIAPPAQVRVFQIFYDAQQRPLLDPAFEPFDNRGDAHPLLEFNVFRKLARSRQTAGARLWGAVSWKFQQKTGISGIELLRLIDANPGYDVYYCNPHPDTESLYPNLWMQGETSHPNFLLLCTEFFQAAGLPTDVLGEIQPSNAFASANYFVATPRFWETYLAFVEGAIDRAEDKLSPTARKMLYSDASDQRAMHARASYMPHIVERLFSLFLAMSRGGLKAYKYPANPRAGAQPHLRLLREMKDVAHRTHSAWLAACWLNYRNLYLASAHDRNWVEKYLKTVTPTQVRFSSFPAAAAPQGVGG